MRYPSGVKMYCLVVAAVLAWSFVGCNGDGTDLKLTDRSMSAEQTRLDYLPGHFLVKFKPELEFRVTDLEDEFGIEELFSPTTLFRIFSLSKDKTPVEMSELVSLLPFVEYAQPDYLLQISDRPRFVPNPPNDPYFARQWHLNTIRAPEAWALESGKPSTVVAVLDTGINRGGQDLVDTAFVAGYDFANDDDDPTDGHGHGTHVAGTIAQSTNNGVGVAGVAPGVSLMAVKVMTDDGSGGISSIAAGLEYAADHGAQVINMSLGTSAWMGDPGDALHDAIKYAHDAGVTIVCASGNDGMSKISYPAAYAETIAVGSVRLDKQVASYSNKGPELDVVAPGGDLEVDQDEDGYNDGVLQETYYENAWGYYFFQGTSMASPHAAGVAALLVSAGARGPEEVRTLMRSTAEDLEEGGWDQDTGDGLIDARSALEALVPQNCAADADCDDHNPCTEEVCVNPGAEDSHCEYTPLPDETRCGADMFCCGGVCGVPVCDGDADCDDGESCTVDSCLAPLTCQAACQHDWPACGAADGCCGSNCEGTGDPDCSVCGDGVCEGAENGEDCDTCPDDCPSLDLWIFRLSCCGDGVCSQNFEFFFTCPVDCPLGAD